MPLRDKPNPVIHRPHTAPVQSLLLYRAELGKMIADHIITEVIEPTDLVNSIDCNIKHTADDKKKVRLHLDLRDM